MRFSISVQRPSFFYGYSSITNDLKCSNLLPLGLSLYSLAVGLKHTLPKEHYDGMTLDIGKLEETVSVTYREVITIPLSFDEIKLHRLEYLFWHNNHCILEINRSSDEHILSNDVWCKFILLFNEYTLHFSEESYFVKTNPSLTKLVSILADMNYPTFFDSSYIESYVLNKEEYLDSLNSFTEGYEQEQGSWTA